VLGVATIAAVATLKTITLSGRSTAGQYVSIIVFRLAVSYILLNTDTLTTAATALTALLVARRVSDLRWPGNHHPNCRRRPPRRRMSNGLWQTLTTGTRLKFAQND
jgi:hypothetical protein